MYLKKLTFVVFVLSINSVTISKSLRDFSGLHNRIIKEVSLEKSMETRNSMSLLTDLNKEEQEEAFLRTKAVLQCLLKGKAHTNSTTREIAYQSLKAIDQIIKSEFWQKKENWIMNIKYPCYATYKINQKEYRILSQCLAYLTDTSPLKVDRSFFRPIEDNSKELAFVEQITHLWNEAIHKAPRNKVINAYAISFTCTILLDELS